MSKKVITKSAKKTVSVEGDLSESMNAMPSDAGQDWTDRVTGLWQKLVAVCLGERRTYTPGRQRQLRARIRKMRQTHDRQD